MFPGKKWLFTHFIVSACVVSCMCTWCVIVYLSAFVLFWGCSRRNVSVAEEQKLKKASGSVLHVPVKKLLTVSLMSGALVLMCR